MRPGFWQILIVIALAVVLFGAKKIPELARSIVKAMGEINKGLAECEKEDEGPADEPEAEPKKVAEKV